MIRTLEAVLDRHIARGQIDQAAGNEERRNLARSALLEKQRRIGDARQAADSGTDHGAGGATILLGGGMPIGIIERLARRSHREDDEVVDLALVLRLHPLVGIESLAGTITSRHHACDPARQIGYIESINLPGAAFAI